MQVVTAAAAALLSLDLVERIWGIEPAWSWLPHTPIGFGLMLALGLYVRWFRLPPFGPYAPRSRRRRLQAGLVVVAVFAGVLAPTVAQAH